MGSATSVKVSQVPNRQAIPQGGSVSVQPKLRQQDNDHDHDKVRESHHEDRYTPSLSSNPEPGLFQASPLSFFSAAAEFCLAKSRAPQTPPAPSQASSSTSAATASSSSSAPSTGTGSPSSSAASAPSAPAAPNITQQNLSGSTSSSGTSINPGSSGLDALNKTLSALGLSTDQVNACDQVAGLIKAFSPDSFASLVSQL